MVRYFKFIIISLFIAFLTTSCFQNRLKVFRATPEIPDVGGEIKLRPPEYKLKKFDRLYIRLNSENEEISDIVQLGQNNNNMNMNMGGGNTSGANFYLTGYTVNDTGYIEVPTLGSFYVFNHTVEEVQKMVQERTDEYFYGVKAVVKLVSFKITFIGEFGHSVQYFYQEELHLLEVLARIGGNIKTGRMDKILIFRKTDDGYKTFRVDITKRDIMNTADFYLLPNDIVYVEPNMTKAFKVGLGELMFYISSVTSIATLVLLYLKL